MTKAGQEIASYYWISGKTPTKNSVEECSLKILVSIVKLPVPSTLQARTSAISYFSTTLRRNLCTKEVGM